MLVGFPAARALSGKGLPRPTNPFTNGSECTCESTLGVAHEPLAEEISQGVNWTIMALIRGFNLHLYLTLVRTHDRVMLN